MFAKRGKSSAKIRRLQIVTGICPCWMKLDSRGWFLKNWKLSILQKKKFQLLRRFLMQKSLAFPLKVQKNINFQLLWNWPPRQKDILTKPKVVRHDKENSNFRGEKEKKCGRWRERKLVQPRYCNKRDKVVNAYPLSSPAQHTLPYPKLYLGTGKDNNYKRLSLGLSDLSILSLVMDRPIYRVSMYYYFK